jgi:hypothetical protein
MVLGPHRLEEGSDGDSAWRIGLDGKPATLNGKELEAALANAWIDNLAWLAADQGGGRIALAAARTEDSGSYDVLEVSPPAGHARELWFDTTSGLLSRIVETAAEPVLTTELSDYRAAGGVLMAHHVVKRLAGMPANTLTMSIDAVWTNEALDPGLFIPPQTAKRSIRYLGTEGSARIPFEYSTRLLWVRASVNGGPPAAFILDSGASITVVDRGHAASVGVETLGEAEALGAGAAGQASFARLASLRIGAGDAGGVELADRAVGVLPISASIAPVAWRDVGGLLGADIMSDFVVDIDYDHRVLTLSDSASYRYQGSGSALPLTFTGGIPVVSLMIDGRQGNFRVDLGASAGAVLHPAFVEREGIRVAGAIGSSGGGFGGRYAKQLFRMESMRLGPLEWQAPLVGLTRPRTGVLASADYDGVIGNLVLQRFRCTFDYERRLLYLEPGALARSTDPFTRVGVTFARSGDDVSVLSVMDRSPAEEAGVRPGDVVRTIDHRPASAWDPDQLRQRFEDPGLQRVDLVISRDGAERTLVVHARRLL